MSDTKEKGYILSEIQFLLNLEFHEKRERDRRHQDDRTREENASTQYQTGPHFLQGRIRNLTRACMIEPPMGLNSMELILIFENVTPWTHNTIININWTVIKSLPPCGINHFVYVSNNGSLASSIQLIMMNFPEGLGCKLAIWNLHLDPLPI